MRQVFLGTNPHPHQKALACRIIFAQIYPSPKWGYTIKSISMDDINPYDDPEEEVGEEDSESEYDEKDLY